MDPSNYVLTFETSRHLPLKHDDYAKRRFTIFWRTLCIVLRLFQHTLQHTLEKPLATSYKGNPFSCSGVRCTPPQSLQGILRHGQRAMGGSGNQNCLGFIRCISGDGIRILPSLGGGFKFFLFSPLLGKISILTSIFFRWVGSTTNSSCIWQTIGE